MKKTAIYAALGATLIFSSPAMAQEEATTEIYIGGNTGYHFLGTNPLADQENGLANDGFIFGGYIGAEAPLTTNIVVGIEGNYEFGTDGIDAGYGAVGKLGLNVGDKSQIFVRGGLQVINIDLENVTGFAGLNDNDDIDDTFSDYLIGIGAQIKADDNYRVRLVADTVGFETLRVTFGIQYNF